MEAIATTLNRGIKTIPTYFNGIKFRSRLEASYAKALLDLGMLYAYEPEGYEIDGTFYLPDFYLPEIKTYLEIKGPLVPGLEKAEKLYKYLNRDQEEGFWWDPHYAVVWGDELGRIKNFIDGDSVCIAHCGLCNKMWFMAWGGSYVCRACRHGDGDHHLLGAIDNLTLQQISFNKRG
jgi:hypothetical protein